MLLFLKYVVPERLFVVGELAGRQWPNMFMKMAPNFSCDEWEIDCLTTCWLQSKWLYLRNTSFKRTIVSSLFCPDTCLYGTLSCDPQVVEKAVEILWNHSGGVSRVEGWALQCLISAWFIAPNSFSVHLHGRAVLPLHNTCSQHIVMKIALCISYGYIHYIPMEYKYKYLYSPYIYVTLAFLEAYC